MRYLYSSHSMSYGDKDLICTSKANGQMLKQFSKKLW